MPGQEYYQSQFTGQQIDQKLNSIPTKVSDLTNDSGFIANTVNNLVNYYLKSDTYSKSEVDSIINTIKNGRFQNVNSLPEEDIDTNVIYLVQKQNTENNNIKDEYINLDGTSTGWEKIGSTEINLDGYVTIQALNTALSNYVQSSNIVTILANRTSFSSVENMVATPSADLYDGCLAYVTATKKNYQYDSSNEADPTLGKWRELQTGGGGSSYTAGDGIDITSDVISTKQSEQGDMDEIVDSLPQGGTLVHIADAFNRGDIYSETEKMVGQWISGKPLYQKYVVRQESKIDVSLNGSNDHPRTLYTKTYTSSTVVRLANIIAYTDTSGNDGYIVVKKNSEQLMKMYITSDKNTAYDGVVDISIDNGDIVTIEGSWDNTHTSIKWKLTADCYEYDIEGADFFFEKMPNVINYTKSADSPIAIGEETEYSTTEKIVGTWIDGSPVYQKTFTGTTSSDNTDTVITHGLPIDIGLVVNGYVIGDSENSTYIPIGFHNGVNYFGVFVTKTQIQLRAHQIYWNKSFVITIQYTKTT